MKNLIVIICIGLLLTSSAFCIVGLARKTPWDLLLSVNIDTETGLTNYAGAEFDGTYFYVSKGSSANLIQQFDRNGSLVKNISIPGVPFIQDLAYDGTYFYGGAVDYVIYQMNFTSQTLVEIIPSPIRVSGIAYNKDLDAFYVSWWSDTVALVARNGAVLKTISMTQPANVRFGLAYENVSVDGPYLWIFDQGSLQQNERARIYQYNLRTDNFTGFYYDVGGDMGSGWGIAKGLFAAADYKPGRFCIGGLMADSGFPPFGKWTGDFLFVYELISTNLPPQTPDTPTGPITGYSNVSYSFNTTTIDLDGDNIYYQFDWGDGNFSVWLGPYPSGETATTSHAWTSAGTYNIKVNARDTIGDESDWSPAHSIEILGGPILEISTIKSGVKIKVVIENNGGVDAPSVNYSINLEGGAIIGKSTTGTTSIAAGGSAELLSDLIIGFGKTEITVTANVEESNDTATRSGFVIFFYTFVRAGG